MFRLDPHVHSRFFHGFGPRATAFDPVGGRLATAIARERNLDGLAFTNHDYAWTPSGDDVRPTADGGRRAADASRSAADGERTAGDASRSAADGFATVPGIEVSTTRGHVLVVGPDPPEATDPGMLTPDETVELAHERDCAAIMAHPFRNGDLPDCDADFDAVEVNGKHPAGRPAVERLAAERDLPIVGGSDAHYPIEVGRAHTRIAGTDRSPAGVVSAIREGRVDPVQASYAIDRVLSPLYRAVHRRKGHVP